MSRFEPPDKESLMVDCFRASYVATITNTSNRLVHGIVTTPTEKRIKAWTEQENIVFDYEENKSYLKETFYRIYEIKLTVRYDRDEAYAECIKHESYGHWHPIFDDFIQRI